MTEIEQFIREAAAKRGITPDVAVMVAKREGGVDEPARVGKFATGWSFWPFQLHYGGPGYEQFGTVAGMGGAFTELTGWQPGDPNAWRDSVRYALNRAKAGGWTPWYGAAAAGVSQWYGIDRSVPWDADSERWDYEGATTMPPTPPRVTFDRDVPAIAQNDPWSCGPTSTRWAMTALGRNPAESWMESTMIAEGVVSPSDGILDATGAGIADFVRRQYGEFGYTAGNSPSISFQALAEEAGTYPLLIGGRGWNHWSGVRGYDPQRDVLLLANPAAGWHGIGQTMSRTEFAAQGPFSAVRITHPDLAAPAAPPPVSPSDTDTLRAENARLQAKVNELVSALAFLGDDQGDRLQAVLNELRRVRLESVGPRPA